MPNTEHTDNISLFCMTRSVRCVFIRQIRSIQSRDESINAIYSNNKSFYCFTSYSRQFFHFLFLSFVNGVFLPNKKFTKNCVQFCIKHCFYNIILFALGSKFQGTNQSSAEWIRKNIDAIEINVVAYSLYTKWIVIL